MRSATSISVGYMSENYVDLGFPGMLAGVFVIGLFVAAACRYFMAAAAALDRPRGHRPGVHIRHRRNGVEMSLPKLLGATVMLFVVLP